MNVSDAIAERVSIRAFKPDPVAGDLVAEILERAARAPSALEAATRSAGVQLPNKVENGREDAAIDADRRAGEAQELRTIGVDDLTQMPGLEPSESGKGRDKKRKASFLKRADQISGAQLTGRLELCNQPRLHSLKLTVARA